MPEQTNQPTIAIERLVEATNVVIPDYTNTTFSEAQIERGDHRAFVVGKGAEWDADGKNQVDYLRSQGLAPRQEMGLFTKLTASQIESRRLAADRAESDRALGRKRRSERVPVHAAIEQGGPRSLVLRGRRRVAQILSPYPKI